VSHLSPPSKLCRALTSKSSHLNLVETMLHTLSDPRKPAPPLSGEKFQKFRAVQMEFAAADAHFLESGIGSLKQHEMSTEQRLILLDTTRFCARITSDVEEKMRVEDEMMAFTQGLKAREQVSEDEWREGAARVAEMREQLEQAEDQITES
jgi:hypothetical protein